MTSIFFFYSVLLILFFYNYLIKLNYYFNFPRFEHDPLTGVFGVGIGGYGVSRNDKNMFAHKFYQLIDLEIYFLVGIGGQLWSPTWLEVQFLEKDL